MWGGWFVATAAVKAIISAHEGPSALFAHVLPPSSEVMGTTNLVAERCISVKGTV